MWWMMSSSDREVCAMLSPHFVRVLQSSQAGLSFLVRYRPNFAFSCSLCSFGLRKGLYNIALIGPQGAQEGAA